MRHGERRVRVMIDTLLALIWCMIPEGKPSNLNRRLIDFVSISLELLTALGEARTLADLHRDDRHRAVGC